MSATIVCHNCHHPSTFITKIQNSCPSCNEPYLQAAVQSALDALRRERPILLTVATALSWIAAFSGILGLLSLVPGFSGEFSILDEPVDQLEWSRRMGPFIVVLSWLTFVATYALMKERSWSRHVIIVILIGLTVMEFTVQGKGPEDGFSFGCSGIVLLVLASLYLYGKQNVVDYYKELRRKAE